MNLAAIAAQPAGAPVVIREGDTYSLATLARNMTPADRSVPVYYTHVLNPLSEPAPWNHHHPRRSRLGAPGAGWAVTADEVVAAGYDAVDEFTQAWRARRRAYLNAAARLDAKRAKARALATR